LTWRNISRFSVALSPYQTNVSSLTEDRRAPASSLSYHWGYIYIGPVFRQMWQDGLQTDCNRDRWLAFSSSNAKRMLRIPSSHEASLCSPFIWNWLPPFSSPNRQIDTSNILQLVICVSVTPKMKNDLYINPSFLRRYIFVPFRQSSSD
jgi:hypothetical protein